jgi:protein SCO1/2
MKYLVPLFLALFVAGCGRPGQKTQPSQDLAAESKAVTYAVKGILRSTDLPGGSVTVEHEAIPGYMPAMTMPFEVTNMEEVRSLQAGDGISFKLVVTDQNSWIEEVTRITSGEVKLPPRRTAIVAAGGEVPRVKEGDPVPSFTLIDQRGRSITPATFAGQPYFVTFVFTRCPIPNFCPLMSENFSAIRKAMAEQSEHPRIQFLSISFDPEFDTPEVLAQYAERYHADGEQWRFATGTPEEIRLLTKSFAVYVQPEQGSISHGLATALIGPDGKIRRIFRGNKWAVEEALDAVKALDLRPSTAVAETTSQ